MLQHVDPIVGTEVTSLRGPDLELFRSVANTSSASRHIMFLEDVGDEE